jgi:hypothetical protein
LEIGMLDSMPAQIAGLVVISLVAGFSAVGEAAQVEKGKTPKPPAAREGSDPWFLAASEGECAPPSILGKKGPEYSDIQSPQELVEKLRAAGHEAELKEFKASSRPAVEVRAPSVGFAVMFVKRELCEKIRPAPEEGK